MRLWCRTDEGKSNMANDLLNQLITQANNEVAPQRDKKRLDYVLLDGSGSMIGRWTESLERYRPLCSRRQGRGRRDQSYPCYILRRL